MDQARLAGIYALRLSKLLYGVAAIGLAAALAITWSASADAVMKPAGQHQSAPLAVPDRPPVVATDFPFYYLVPSEAAESMLRSQQGAAADYFGSGRPTSPIVFIVVDTPSRAATLQQDLRLAGVPATHIVEPN